MSFALVARELINLSNPNVSMLNPGMIVKLEEEGWKMFKGGFVIESIKLFTLTSNPEKLVTIGEWCLKEGKLVYAYHSLKGTRNLKLLTDLGIRLISENKFEDARNCFEACDNKEMLLFLEKNF